MFPPTQIAAGTTSCRPCGAWVNDWRTFVSTCAGPAGFSYTLPTTHRQLALSPR